jgi:hypothetical protein
MLALHIIILFFNTESYGQNTYVITLTENQSQIRILLVL